ncbi:hypothetical protein [Paenibacillus sp. FSL H7-0331]|uniref:hypothetical protein n=1 Tax=Paenibacillus sp. FSL H7-0331 TaxID=1920421 RepID=UPI00096C033A|nr:hypothetical protein [Paenibacillus sp. FSL H7-0331]OME95706.1 hypothetical protein BK127_41330 [Paenibacillus sp. FSL H7-0331]
MSYDLMVFEPSKAPRDRRAFMQWYDQEVQWSENHDYNDPLVCSETLHRLYQKLSEHFPNMNVEIKEKIAEYKIEFLTKRFVKEQLLFETEIRTILNNDGYKVFDALFYWELHEITTEGGNNKWNKAVFSVQPDGAFDMKFIWDQELQDEIERLAK